MESPQPDNVLYEFGPFLLDPVDGSLTANGHTITLTPKAFQLLTLLIEQSGRTVDKQFLLDTLWPDVFVEEGSLTQLVFQLRKNLRYGSQIQQWIETVPKRGYRFTVAVKVLRNDRNERPSSVEKDDEYAPASVSSAPEEQTGRIKLERNGNGDFLNVLARTQPAKSSTTAIETRSINKSRIALVTSAGLALVIVSSFIAIRYYRQRSSSAVSRPPFQTIGYRKLTSSGHAMLPAVSPDGNFTAYVEVVEGKQGLWVQQNSSTSRVQVMAPAEVEFVGVTYHPSGHSIYYVVSEKGDSSGVVYQVSALGGTPQRVLERVDSPVTFSPDGSRFAFIRRTVSNRESALIVAQTDGTGEQKLSSRTGKDSYVPGPAWSPDGTLIACAASGFDTQDSFTQIVTVRVADGVETALGPRDWISIGQLAWLKGGTGVVFQAWAHNSPIFADQLWFLPYPSGQPVPVTKDLATYEGVSSAAGSDVVATWRTDRLSHITVTSGSRIGETKQIRSSTGDNYSEVLGLDWTPDHRIVLSSNASGNTDLWIMNADGANQKQLTYDARREAWPVVSNDGRFVVFSVRGHDGLHLWRVDIDGSNRRQLTFGKGETDHALSPDNKWLFFTSFESGQPRVTKMPLEGGTQVALTPSSSGRATVSPDGRFVACLMRDKNARLVVGILSVDGGEPVKIFDQMPMPEWFLLRWTPDGRGLAYISTRDGVSNIWVQSIAGGPPKQITHFTEDYIYRFGWSRDGRILALDRGSNIKDIILITDFR